LIFSLHRLIRSSVNTLEGHEMIDLCFVKLAITVGALSHLECASGRHEEGIAARTELTKLRKHLGILFPSLSDPVEVGLNREWKNILNKYNLVCGHQDKEWSSEGSIDLP